MLRLSAIGDVCNTVPLIRNLQAAWPETPLTWLIGKIERSVVGDIPGIEFLTYDKAAGTLDGLPVGDVLRQRRFGLLLDLQASWRANILALRVHAPVKLGFDRRRARDGQWLFTNRRIAPAPQAHVAEGFLSFGDALGIARGPLRWEIPIPEADRAFAAELIPDHRPTLVLSPCSSQRARNFRNWPAERYAAVVKAAHERHGLHTLITGGTTALERDYARRIVELSDGHAQDRVGRTSLKQLLALIERALCVLAPDSGPLHMASAVGTPAIGLYATSNPARTGPLDARWCVNVYEQALRSFSGRAVEQVRWGQRVRDPAALELITVEVVQQRIEAILATDPAQRRPPWLAERAHPA